MSSKGINNPNYRGGNRMVGNYPCPQCGTDRECEKRNAYRICKECFNSRPKNFDWNAWRLRTQQATKKEAMLMLGGECVMCGVKDLPPCCYQFDHIDPSTKSFTLGHKFNQKLSPQIVAELKKCQLLCANCHAIKTWMIKVEDNAWSTREAGSYS